MCYQSFYVLSSQNDLRRYGKAAYCRCSASVLTLLSICILLASADSSMVDGINVRRDGSATIITISGEENIRNYLESIGEEYDPDLVLVQRTLYDVSAPRNNEASPNVIFREYVARNTTIKTFTDFSNVIAEYRRPAGNIELNEVASVKNTLSASGSVTADIVEIALGFSVEEYFEWSIKWEGSFSYPVRLKVYPVIEQTSGEIWDDDPNKDDYIGSFTVDRVIGDDVRAYRG